MRTGRSALLAAVLLGAVQPAAANVGTPLMWTGMCHLLFLNAAIGVAEGLLIARWTGARRGVCVGWMIAANYLSAWAGAFSLPVLARFLQDGFFAAPPLLTAGRVVVMTALAALVATLLIEVPFAFAAGRNAASARRIFRAFVLSQLITYAGLAILYLLVCPVSLFTAVSRHATPWFLPSDQQAWVYYLNDGDGDVWRIRLDGTEKGRVVALGATPESTGYLTSQTLYADRTETEAWALYAGRATQRDGLFLIELPGIPGLFYEEGPDGHRFYELTADFVPQDGSTRAIPGYFSEEGLRVRPASQARWSLTYVTPWGGWRARDVTNLPGGLHVLTFGPRQIVVLDSKSRRLAFLVRGWSPIVVLDDMH